MAGMGWDLIGHAWAVDMLRQHIVADRLRHAYLFSGPQGVGRRTLALNFAQAINCPTPTAPGVPCGTCRTCQQIARMQQADLSVTRSEAEGESLKIDQVRDLQRALSLAPYESAYRVALLLRFEEATDGAQNALLKTLEEPNERVVLLVTADEPENLLPTIASRCELLRLRPLPLNELANALVEKKSLEAEKARLIAHIAGGRPGYALRLAEDESLLATRQEWLEDLFTLVSASRRERLAYSESKSHRRDRAETKQTLRAGLAHWLSLWRDVLLAASGSGAALANLDYADQITALAVKVGEKSAAKTVARLEHAFARLPNANLQLMLDALLLEWPRF
ncbi:MAG: DNA polymerase III subunit delta' C-terminal domain-containing protein [Pelolinea sp.]|nr:DNA polymerase III subunit delta' C-terminal domain-containing protein [Pelolinea sp.]